MCVGVDDGQKLGSGFIDSTPFNKEGALRIDLKEICHPKPMATVVIYSATRNGFVNNNI